MFQGEFSITLDDKGRLAIPTACREIVARDCGNQLVITYNPHELGCLWIFPRAHWVQVSESVNRLPSAKAVHRLLQRKLVGAAAFVEPDGSGRILLPASQRATCGIERKAVLLGMGKKLELWSDQAHQEQSGKVVAEEDVSEAMLELEF